MSGDNGEALALQSIAEVITEARALAERTLGSQYDLALVDLTMARLRPDIEFLILGANEDVVLIGGEPYVEAPRPSNGTAKVKDKAPAKFGGYVTESEHGKYGRVRHLRKDCGRMVRAFSYVPASPQDVRTLPLCLQCKD